MSDDRQPPELLRSHKANVSGSVDVSAKQKPTAESNEYHRSAYRLARIYILLAFNLCAAGVLYQHWDYVRYTLANGLFALARNFHDDKELSPNQASKTDEISDLKSLSVIIPPRVRTVQELQDGSHNEVSIKNPAPQKLAGPQSNSLSLLLNPYLGRDASPSPNKANEELSTRPQSTNNMTRPLEEHSNPTASGAEQSCQLVHFISLGLLQEAEKFCDRAFLKTEEGRRVIDATSGCVNVGEAYKRSSVERGRQVFEIEMRDNGRDIACFFAAKSLAVNSTAQSPSTQSTDTPKKSDVVFLDLSNPVSYEGWWCDTKGDCSDEDHVNCLALGRWERINGQPTVGRGKEILGGYGIGCSLKNKKVNENIIQFDGTCEEESQKYKGRIKYKFIDRDHVKIDSSIIGGELIRCPKS